MKKFALEEQLQKISRIEKKSVRQGFELNPIRKTVSEKWVNIR